MYGLHKGHKWCDYLVAILLNTTVGFSMNSDSFSSGLFSYFAVALKQGGVVRNIYQKILTLWGTDHSETALLIELR